MAVTVTYGDYNFVPKPLFTINSEPMKTPDGSGYGIMHRIVFEGDLITINDEISSGILGVFDKVEQLKNALDHDGKLLLIACSGSPILSGYPTISSYSFDNETDNFTRRATYTIDFEMPTTIRGSGNDPFNDSTFPPFIESCDESWDVSFQDERMPFDWTLQGGTVEKFGYTLAVTHTVNVQARITYTGSEVSNIPWQDAKSYATGRLGFDNEFVTLTGVLGLPGGGYFSKSDVFNNYRQVSIDKTAGSINVTETFIVTPSGTNSLPNNAIETFDISSSQTDGVVNITINGEIQGLDTISYTGDGGSNDGFIVLTNKYDAASGYFSLIKDRLYDRARTAYSGITDTCFNRPLNPQTRTRTVGINPLQGIITYSYEYDTTPVGCITGDCIISQNITIDDTLENDVFASQVVLSRAAGPILQDIGTITARIRTVNIELVTLPPTGCGSITEIYKPVPTGQVENFISVISGDLGSNYDQVFVSSQNQSWNFSVGRYTKSIAFTYTNCDA